MTSERTCNVAEHHSCFLNIQFQEWSPQAHLPASALYKARGESWVSKHVNCAGMSKPAQSCKQVPGAAGGNAHVSEPQLQAVSCIMKWGGRVRSQKGHGLGEEKERDLHWSGAWITVIPDPSNPVPPNQADPRTLPASCCWSFPHKPHQLL